MATALPNWLKWYKKPSYVDLKAFASSLNIKIEERDTGTGSGSARDSVLSSRSDLSIPQNLALDRILSNKTCSPMSLYDFYMYLKHIEFSQENLEFYTWFKDYEKRWEKEALQARSTTSKSRSLQSDEEQTLPTTGKDEILVDEKQILILDGLDISPEFVTFIESLVLYKAARYPRPCCTAFITSKTDDRDEVVGEDTAPICIPLSIQQQHHQELQQIVALFLTPGGPKELNIPPSMRKVAINGILTSDSPANFSKIAEHVYSLLRNCSHRNFVRLGINNGTFETLCMVTFVGILFTILGFLIMILIAFARSPHLYSSSRWRGLATIPFWLIGIVFLLAGMRGSCFLLLLFSRRQELPWERVEDASSVKTSSSSNSVVRFARKMMIFERKIRVKDVGLRHLQRKIVVQSIIGAIVGTTVLEVFFLCLPIWKESR